MAYEPLKACKSISEVYQCVIKTRQTPIAIRIEDLVTNGRGYSHIDLGSPRPDGPTPDFWLQTALRAMDLNDGKVYRFTVKDDIPDSNGSLIRAIESMKARGAA